MARNLYNEYYESKFEIAEKYAPEILNSKKYYVKQGFVEKHCSTERNKGYSIEFASEKPKMSNVAGIYLIGITRGMKDYYLYLGRSCNIDRRVYRFIKELFAKSRHDEGHPAGKKMRLEFGRGNLENLFIKILPCENYKEVEKELIRIIKPRYNVK